MSEHGAYHLTGTCVSGELLPVPGFHIGPGLVGLGFADFHADKVISLVAGVASQGRVERFVVFEPLGSGLQGFHRLVVVPFGGRDRRVAEQVADLGERDAAFDET